MFRNDMSYYLILLERDVGSAGFSAAGVIKSIFPFDYL